MLKLTGVITQITDSTMVLSVISKEINMTYTNSTIAIKATKVIKIKRHVFFLEWPLEQLLRVF
jgi:hypothetical protein